MNYADVDHRYTIRVYLLRADRVKYWSFHCPNCGKKLCEINGNVLYMTDITNDGETTGILGTNRIQCKRAQCRFWIEFSMN